MLKNKKIIVTGGNGFIGSHLVERLSKDNDVRVIDNLSSDASEPHYCDDAIYGNVNICDYKNIKHVFHNADYVFHFAAEARIQPTLENPVLAAETNVVGTATVLQCAKEAGVKRVMYSSTSSAYGLKNKIPLSEDMENDCLNPYSVTKTSGEELCKMYTNLFGLETVVFRYFNVFGPRQPIRGQYAPVIGIFLRQFKAGEKMTIVGDGSQRRDFTHVNDVVEANIRAATAEDVVGETINVGTGTNYSVSDIANMIKGPIINIPERKGESKETLACTKKIEKLLKFKPTDCLEEFINENRK